MEWMLAAAGCVHTASWGPLPWQVAMADCGHRGYWPLKAVGSLWRPCAHTTQEAWMGEGYEEQLQASERMSVWWLEVGADGGHP